MENISKKKRIYNVLADMKEGEILDTVAMLKTADSSMAYINSTLKYALELEFLKFHDSGNYMISALPTWTVYKEKMTRAADAYRKSLPSYGGKGGYRKGGNKPPKDYKFELNTDNILNVIRQLVEERTAARKELVDTQLKYKKALKFAKKLKKQRDEFEQAFAEID